jgi:hypothetical protein
MADEEITLTKAQVAELKKANDLLQALHGDAATSLQFKKLVKSKFPNWSDPELDAAEKIAAAREEVSKGASEEITEVKKMLQEIRDERKKEQEDNKVGKFKEKIEEVRQSYGYTEEGMQKVLELMDQRGITDPEDAAIIFEKRQPKQPAEHKPYSSRMAFVQANGKEDQSFKNLMADPDQWMEDEFRNILRENVQ